MSTSMTAEWVVVGGREDLPAAEGPEVGGTCGGDWQPAAEAAAEGLELAGASWTAALYVRRFDHPEWRPGGKFWNEFDNAQDGEPIAYLWIGANRWLVEAAGDGEHPGAVTIQVPIRFWQALGDEAAHAAVIGGWESGERPEGGMAASAYWCGSAFAEITGRDRPIWVAAVIL